MKYLKTYEIFFNKMIIETEEEIKVKSIFNKIKETFNIDNLKSIPEKRIPSNHYPAIYIYKNNECEFEINRIKSGGTNWNYIITVNDHEYNVRYSIGNDIFEFFDKKYDYFEQFSKRK